jgi:hypothetical protein
MKSEEALEQIAYLKEIAAKSRLIAAYGYPFFILWGIITAIGYIGSLVFSTHFAWLIVVVGTIISILMRIESSNKTNANRLLKQLGLQSLILVMAGILIFIYLREYHDPLILNAFPPFLFGVIYLVNSVHIGRDLAFIGLWLALTSAISLLFSSPFQDIWLAVTWSGGLIFTGIIFKIQIRKLES